MKKKYFSVAIILTVAASLSLSSCIGSFQLTNKVLDWNKQVGGKFVNELVFFAFWILPVYEITGAVDLLVINSIEFWSGQKTIADATLFIDGKDARYEVNRDMAGYTITNLSTREVTRFDFNGADNSWSVSANGKTVKFMEFIDDTHVRMLQGDGTFMPVELSQEGVFAYQQLATPATFRS